MSEFEKYLCPQCGTMQESLKAELARLREQAIDYENDIFLGQPIEYWIRVKAQLDADMSDQYTREILLLKIELARRDEKIAELQFKLDSLCPCETNPQDEHYLLVDEVCPIHGHPHHEIARRDRIIAILKEEVNEAQGDSLARASELAQAWKIISRLKEDGERLYKIDDYCCCIEHENYVTCVSDNDEHSPTCAKHLHRVLMKELE